MERSAGQSRSMDRAGLEVREAGQSKAPDAAWKNDARHSRSLEMLVARAVLGSEDSKENKAAIEEIEKTTRRTKTKVERGITGVDLVMNVFFICRRKWETIKMEYVVILNPPKKLLKLNSIVV